jgi:hypothetical protein
LLRGQDIKETAMPISALPSLRRLGVVGATVSCLAFAGLSLSGCDRGKETSLPAAMDPAVRPSGQAAPGAAGENLPGAASGSGMPSNPPTGGDPVPGAASPTQR